MLVATLVPVVVCTIDTWFGSPTQDCGCGLRACGFVRESVEETLADALEFLEKADLLKEPRRLPYFYRMTAEE